MERSARTNAKSHRREWPVQMRRFSEKELVDLTAAVIAINAWNRAAIAFRAKPRFTSVRIAARFTRRCSTGTAPFDLPGQRMGAAC